MLKIAIAIGLIVIINSVTISAPKNQTKTFENVGYFLPLDKNGWTIDEPSINSRIIYVSSTEGNDQTARFYSLTSKEVSKNPFLPQGKITMGWVSSPQPNLSTLLWVIN